MFDSLDKDGDGTITFKEMLEVTFPFSSRKEVKRMIDWVNTVKEQGKLCTPMTVCFLVLKRLNFATYRN